MPNLNSCSIIQT